LAKGDSSILSIKLAKGSLSRAWMINGFLPSNRQGG
jgi:hypothetical protein